ncbi:transglutaminase family protein [Micromonosporaceae bacterium Da 78-11]
MTGRRRLGLVAASATLLAAAPLSSIFDTWTWLMQCILAVGLIAGAATLARTLRFPTWAQALSMILVLLLTLTWMFHSGDEILPGPGTFAHFADLFSQAGTDTRSYGVPVPDRDGLLFITVLGIGAVAIAVDLLTVVLRRPALAGLPMLAIYSVPVAVYVDSVPVFPFIVGAIGYLWLLVADNVDRVRRFGRRFTGDGRDVDVWEPSPLAAAGRRLGLVGVAAAVLLPLLIPSISGGLLSRLTQNGSGLGQGNGSGNGGGKISLFASLSGQLTRSDTVTLLKVKTNEPDPFYLRFGVADQLTTAGFSNRPPTGTSVTGGLTDPRTNNTTDGNFQQYRAEVEITDTLRQSMMPVYANPVSTSDLGGGWSYDPTQQVIFSTRNSTKGKNYSFDYVRAKYSPADLRTAPSLSKDDPIRRLYTSTPPDATVSAQVADLTKDETNDYDKVRALYNYFSKDNGFTYSLSTQPASNGSEIAAFLKNKIGYCQQYAAALAWMVRDAGIPARVAFGFTRGQQDGDTYQITNRNAHAWTEVYLQGYGWIPFDATPAAGVAGAARSEWAPDVDRPTPTASTSTTTAPGADPSAAVSRQTRPDGSAFDDAAGTGGTTTGSGGPSATSLLVTGLIVLLIVLLLVPALRRILLRRHRHAVTVPAVTAAASGPAPPGTVRDVVITADAAQAREDAHAAWDELIDTMIDFRVPIDPTETPRVTAQRLVQDAVLLDEPATAAALLGTAEERARYARQPMQGGELTTALGQVRKGLARSATRRTRLLAVVLPPSILLRWRLALGDLSARTVGSAGRAREVLMRFSPRRLLSRSR